VRAGNSWSARSSARSGVERARAAHRRDGRSGPGIHGRGGSAAARGLGEREQRASGYSGWHVCLVSLESGELQVVKRCKKKTKTKRPTEHSGWFNCVFDLFWRVRERGGGDKPRLDHWKRGYTHVEVALMARESESFLCSSSATLTRRRGPSAEIGDAHENART
jgi:hypothetical protein